MSEQEEVLVIDDMLWYHLMDREIISYIEGKRAFPDIKDLEKAKDTAYLYAGRIWNHIKEQKLDPKVKEYAGKIWRAFALYVMCDMQEKEQQK
jgi:hypothetical protein